jgi:hypothetical protein
MQQPLAHTRSDHVPHSSTFPRAYARLSPSPFAPASQTKAAIVTLLAWLLAWRPSVALALGKIVTHIWRGFRGA